MGPVVASPRVPAIAAVLLGLAACSHPSPEAGSGPAPAPPIAPVALLPSAPASVAPSPPPPDSAPPPEAPAPEAASAEAAVPVVDTPPWPETTAGAKVKLTWVVYPFRERRERAGYTRTVRHAELVVRVGTATRRVALGDFSGGMYQQDQHVCRDAYATGHPGQTPRLAGEIAFYEGGWSGITAARDAEGALTLAEWTASDGRCDDPQGCVSPRRTVAVVPIPADAHIEEAIVDVEGPGREHPYECG